jgi:hypothetical protein
VGASQNQPFQLSFNRFLCVAFQGARVTSDGGLILVRELDEQFGLSGLIGEHLVDSGSGNQCRRRGWSAPEKKPVESSERPKRTALAPKPAIAISA